MKTFARRRNIERAIRYRVHYTCYLDDGHVEARDFASTKSLEQWVSRNDNNNTIGIMVIKRMALIDDQWEPYTVIGKRQITLSDLRAIIVDLSDESLKPSEIEK